MKIKVSQLRTLSNKLLDHLEETGHGEVEVSVDFYWDIPAKHRYEPYTEPGKPDMGQLSDDWTELTKIAEGKAKPVNYGLVWLGSIFRRIGETSTG